MSSAVGTIETNIPARLDRLPWARFHRLVIGGLGTVWILDGLFYACGPTPFVEAVAEALVRLGHETRAIKTERFGPTGG